MGRVILNQRKSGELCNIFNSVILVADYPKLIQVVSSRVRSSRMNIKAGGEAKSD